MGLKFNLVSHILEISECYNYRLNFRGANAPD